MMDVKARIERYLNELNDEYDYDLDSQPFPSPASHKENYDQSNYFTGKLILKEINPNNIKLARLMYRFMASHEQSQFQDLIHPEKDKPFKILTSDEIDKRIRTGRNYARLEPGSIKDLSLKPKIEATLDMFHKKYPSHNITKLRELTCKHLQSEDMKISRNTLLNHTKYNPINKK